jgi:hypothetical protein
LAAKVAIVAIAAGGAVGGGVAVQQAVDGSEGRSGPAEQSAPAGTAVGATAGDERGGLGSISAQEKSKGAQGEEKRSEKGSENARDHGRDKQRADNPRRGFEPVQGGSNGERARDFARTRGKGKKLGLVKQEEARARGQAGARRGPKPKKKEHVRRNPPKQHAKPIPPRGQAEPPRQGPPAPPVPRPLEGVPPFGAASKPQSVRSPLAERD